MISMLDQLYREVILDHHREPRGRHSLKRVDRQSQGHNPSCGDEVSVQLELEGNRITDVAVHGQGCAICTASGSMLAELVAGATAPEAETLVTAVSDLLRGEPLPSELTVGSADLGDLDALAGVRKFATRVKCAALPWVTLRLALTEGSTQAGQLANTEDDSEPQAPQHHSHRPSPRQQEPPHGTHS
jgi:nitrogen fixation NifU-like protein